MEAELVALATSGATTLVGLMVSESWAQARGRLVALFSRGRTEATAAVEDELDGSRDEVVRALAASDEPTVADVEAAWRLRLRRLLQADPAAADELRAVLEELGSELPPAETSVVHNRISGGVQHGPVMQGRDFASLTFHAPAAPAAPPAPPVPVDPRNQS
ncbi:hypothetical protein QMK19_27935 [Streptomyces sp. H10-C2]|uniref:hypothetical protein n=1 Tax=unclassified Streptomyces TaxID=2593676 RepID=UPI0024B9C512|nr:MULTISPECIES: hypothetical protein [unclassified Streptomyces]MDJ0343941.1 hypothetical protein [Streptomyces sp. PH10-H1]MDJ0373382.1 hypothetical protein [Streptomyces sp. H10-C2]